MLGGEGSRVLGNTPGNTPGNTLGNQEETSSVLHQDSIMKYQQRERRRSHNDRTAAITTTEPPIMTDLSLHCKTDQLNRSSSCKTN